MEMFGHPKDIFLLKSQAEFWSTKNNPSAWEKKRLLFACYTEGNALAKKSPSTWAAALEAVHSTCQTEVLLSNSV